FLGREVAGRIHAAERAELAEHDLALGAVLRVEAQVQWAEVPVELLFGLAVDEREAGGGMDRGLACITKAGAEQGVDQCRCAPGGCEVERHAEPTEEQR